MPQEAPADTAGPSSSPPRLPEGWLAQWEGVQRKWYFVQRTTGKSQWEIPTEPILLTPSTTPTIIGTGPTQQPPSRPSTISYNMTGSSVDAQVNGADRQPPHDRMTAEWRSHMYSQYLTSGDGGSRGPHQHGIPDQMSFFPAYTHPIQTMGPLSTRTDPSGRIWNDSMNSSAEYNPGYHHDSYQTFGSASQPSQPEWQTGQNTGLQHAPSQTSMEKYSSTNQPHTSYGHPHADAYQAQSSPGYSMTQSHPYQINTFQQQGSHIQGSLGQSSAHGNFSHPSNSMQYQSENTAHAQSAFNPSARHDGQESQTDHSYYPETGHNVGSHQYFPYHPHGAHTSASQPDYSIPHVQHSQAQWASANPELPQNFSPDSRFTNGP